MKLKYYFLLVSSYILLYGCSPAISSSIKKDYAALPFNTKIIVLELTETIPKNAEVIGTLKIRDSGFSTKCNREMALETAKLEAKRVGGNAIKITDEKKPNFWRSCHLLDATILKIKHN